MAPLVVFLIDNEDKLYKWEKTTANKNFHRCFILLKLSYKNKIKFKESDSIFVFDFLKNSKNLLKLVTSYSNAIYTHFLIFYDFYEEIDRKIDDLKKNDFFRNGNNIYFSKHYYVMNNIDYKLEIMENFDLFEISRIMTKFYNDELLSRKEFNLVMSEILPEQNYVIDNDSKIENELKELILTKKLNTASSCLVTDNLNCDEKKICFSFDVSNSYKIVLKREDGLKLYIF